LKMLQKIQKRNSDMALCRPIDICRPIGRGTIEHHI